MTLKKKKAETLPLEIYVDSSVDSHIIHAGEKVEFLISSNRKELLHVEIRCDGDGLLMEKDLYAPASVTASLPHSGFLRCSVTCGETKAVCGVAVDPYNIRPLLEEPADYEQFWVNTFQTLAGIPCDFQKTKIGMHGDMECFRINCKNINGKRAYALLVAPPASYKGKVPLLVSFPGGEAYVSQDAICSSENTLEKRFGFKCAYLLFHLPPYAPCKTVEKAKERHKEFLDQIGLRRYVFSGLQDPERFYARSAVCGCVRLLEEAASLPGIDGENVIYEGSSHGGAFGIYITAFSPRIKAAFCGVPNFGDVGGYLLGRHLTDSDSPEYRSAAMQRLYFDTAFAARRIHVPVFMEMGFIDPASPPGGIFAIYNELQGPKFIYTRVHGSHGSADSPELALMKAAWLKSMFQQRMK